MKRSFKSGARRKVKAPTSSREFLGQIAAREEGLFRMDDYQGVVFMRIRWPNIEYWVVKELAGSLVML